MRQVNKRFFENCFSQTKNNDMMQKLEDFQFSSALCLNVEYCALRLDPKTQDICNIILP